MKKFIIFGVSLFLFSCNDNDSSSSTKDSLTNGDSLKTAMLATPPDPDFTHWKIENKVAWAMINAYNPQSCPDFSITPNSDIEKKIKDANPDYQTGYYPAKHIATNVAEYARLRGWKPNDPRAQVNGKCTQLFKVWGTPSKAKAVADTSYYDLIIICPPPDDCLGVLDSVKNDSLKPKN
jgi:hypothetical protein